VSGSPRPEARTVISFGHAEGQYMVELDSKGKTETEKLKTAR